MIDINELRLLAQDCKLAGSPVFVRVAVMYEILDRLEEVEKEYQHALAVKEIYQRQLNETEAERDELLAALQRIADGQEMSGVFTFADVVLRYQEIARTAIALPGAQGEPK